MNHFDLDTNNKSNEKQPKYCVTWCTTIIDANEYRAGKFVGIRSEHDCYLLNPTCIGDNCSLCFETMNGILVLPYKQIVSIIPQMEKK